MRLVSRLYQRFRRLIHELAKFGLVGAIAFAVTAIGTNVLHFGLGLGPLLSNLLASLAATVTSYAGNRYWTFRHRQGSTVAREYVVFMVLNGLGMAIQLACIWFAYDQLGLRGRLGYNVDVVLGIGLGTLFRFWSYRKWVWRGRAGTVPRLPQPEDPGTGDWSAHTARLSQEGQPVSQEG